MEENLKSSLSKVLLQLFLWLCLENRMQCGWGDSVEGCSEEMEIERQAGRQWENGSGIRQQEQRVRTDGGTPLAVMEADVLWTKRELCVRMRECVCVCLVCTSSFLCCDVFIWSVTAPACVGTVEMLCDLLTCMITLEAIILSKCKTALACLSASPSVWSFSGC